MNEEEFEKIKEKYESSIIKFQQAKKVVDEARAKLEAADIELKNSKAALGIASDDVNESRSIYEKAVYEFYEEYNE